MDPAAGKQDMQGRTVARSRSATAPLRAYLLAESGSSGVLIAAIAAALVWANVDNHSYEAVWRAVISLGIGRYQVALDARTWLNSGLMSLYFLVAGIEARREFDLGELRDRRRVVLPISVGLLAMVVPAGLFLAMNAGSAAARGWGVSMSTDTALALGVLSLVGRNLPDRVRIFLLTMFVADDIASLMVIALGYGERVRPLPVVIAIGLFALLVGLLRTGVDRPVMYAVLGVVIWGALLASGVDPVVAGLAIGVTASAYTPARESLERATSLFRLFREQPTAELARSAATTLTATLSPNARLQRFYQPWTLYVIVPLFGLANAGIVLRGSSLEHAYGGPITLGVMLGYVVGKPVAVIGGTALLARLSRGKIAMPVGWASLVISGTIAGTGFTVSFLIATLAFTGEALTQAKLGVLSAAVISCLLTWLVLRITALLPPVRRAHAILGNLEQLTDLAEPVDPDRDHIRGPRDASVTVVEYADFECGYCGAAESAIRADLATDADVRYVWRHLPLSDVHPWAQLAAEAAEAAAAQGAFWPMHDTLLARQDRLDPDDLLRYAREQGLDVEWFRDDLRRHVHSVRVAQDVESADLSGVAGTPTFFINGRRHYGPYDIGTLTAAIRAARSHAASTGKGKR